MDLTRSPELIDRLAAAYALGTLRGGARRRFEAIARQSPAVRAQAIIWQERFASMTELAPAHLPSPNVWKRIENLLPAQDAPRPAGEQPAVLERLRRLVSLWRGAALAGGMVAVVVAVVGGQLAANLKRQDAALVEASRQRDVLTAQLQAAPQVQYVAVLADDRQAPAMLATFDPKHNTLTLKRVGGLQAGPERSRQRWALPPGAPPRALGVLGDEQVLRLNLTEQQVREVPALAISLEPRGGAPAGSGPTGPVVSKGALLQTAL